MIQYTGSSNPGHGLCCKTQFVGKNPDFIGNDKFICSQPVTAADTKSPYTKILTDDKFNYQIYAFGPTTTSSMCGVPAKVTAAASSKDKTADATKSSPDALDKLDMNLKP